VSTRRRVVTVLLPVAVLAAGCGSPVTAGTVVERQHVPARDWTDNIPIYIRHCVTVPYTRTSGYGASQRTVYSSRQLCTSALIGFSPVRRHEDQYWRLELRDDKDAKHLGWVDVSSADYDWYEVGSHYPRVGGTR